ncbi:alpha/beta fold hydrolase [Pseudomonadota bacterium]
MTTKRNPIGLFDRLVARVLMLVTPEHKYVKAARKVSTGPLSAPQPPNLIKPEHTRLENLQIRFAKGGTAGKPVILLLNPLPQSIVCYEPIWRLLADDHHLFALDLPGFGGSEGGGEVMNTVTQSSVVAAFVQEMGLRDFHLVGPDIGMPVALHYALRDDCKAKSLLVGDGPCISPSYNGSIIDHAVESSLWRLIFRIGGAGPFVAGANHLGYVNYSPCPEELADYVASYKGRIGSVMEWFRAYPEIIGSIQPRLSEIELPIQIFWGDLDQLLLVETANKIHALLPNSKLTVFENCGHFSYQDKSNEFASMVTGWVHKDHISH